MSVKLRLRREGTTKRPHYRVVAADHRAPRDGRFIEIIGEYHPMDEPSKINIDNERAIHWLRNGAQATEAVEKLLRISGAWEEFKPGDKPKRDRSAQPEKKRLSKRAKAKLEQEQEAKAAPPVEAAGAEVADAPEAPAAESEETPADENPAEETPAEAEETAEEPAAAAEQTSEETEEASA